MGSELMRSAGSKMAPAKHNAPGVVTTLKGSAMAMTEKLVAAPRWISLREWAKKEYGDRTPHINTLLKWVHTGRIQPQPEKHGALWRVRPNAAYQAD